MYQIAVHVVYDWMQCSWVRRIGCNAFGCVAAYKSTIRMTLYLTLSANQETSRAYLGADVVICVGSAGGS
jgi:hypothetical protein